MEKLIQRSKTALCSIMALFIITVFAITNCAHAQNTTAQMPDWVELGDFYVQDQSFDTDNPGEAVFTRGFIDKASIRKIPYIEGHKAEFYEYTYLEQFARPLKIGNFSVGYRAKTNYTNCEDRHTGTGYVKLYDVHNKLLTEMNMKPPKMLRVKKGTISETIFEYLCKQKYE